MFDADWLSDRLRSFAGAHAPPSRYVVAFSGGLDSTVLLHALVSTEPDAAVLALHVDHRLDPESGERAERAAGIAASFDADVQTIAAQVDASTGRGPEAAAREARYAALRNQVRPGDWLMTAHHRDDQAETLLLNLLRGSGPLGLAAMPPVRDLDEALLVRPLLDVSRADLAAYASGNALVWLDDPGNEEPGFDRNFLRQDVLPLLRSRWPAAGEALAQSAKHAADVQHLLDELAAFDLSRLEVRSADRLPVSGLRALDPLRRDNLLRHACRKAGLAPPPRGRLRAVSKDLLDAAPDREPVVRWPGAEIRRYRDELFVLRERAAAPRPQRLTIGGPAELGRDHGRLELVQSDDVGIAGDIAARGLDLRFRSGGEKLKIAPGAGRRALKNLFQEAGVLPWMRDRIPLLMDGKRLVAVGDLWIDADCTESGGYRVRWHRRPQLR